MKILLFADLHAEDPKGSPSTRKRLHYVKQFFKDVLSICKQQGITRIICLGDMWSSKYKVETETLKTLLECFHELRHITFYWICGNHEYPNRWLLSTIGKAYPSVQAIVDEPLHISTTQDSLILFPYLPPPQFKEALKKFTLENVRERDKRENFLFTHIALREGKPTLTQEVDQPVSLKDLYPEMYSGIFLGDYHNHQVIEDKAVYLGSPFALDYGCVNVFNRVWILDTIYGNLDYVELPSAYPEFFQMHHIYSEEFQPLFNYNPINFYRIFCPEHLVVEYRLHYPEAEVIPVQSVSEKKSRIDLSSTSESSRIEKYVEITNPKLDHNKLITIGKEVLQLCQK